MVHCSTADSNWPSHTEGLNGSHTSEWTSYPRSRTVDVVTSASCHCKCLCGVVPAASEAADHSNDSPVYSLSRQTVIRSVHLYLLFVSVYL